MEILENRDAWTTAYQDHWLAHFESTGKFDWKLYTYAKNRTSPGGAAIDLSRSRLMLVTSSGAYLRADQSPFDAAHDLGDYDLRLFPTATPLADLAYAHNHYDHAAVDADPQVLLPLRHLEDLVKAGTIGKLAPSTVSFMGYQPDLARVIDEMVPRICQVARDEEVDAVLLVPA